MGKSVGKGVISAGFPRLLKEEMALLCGMLRVGLRDSWGLICPRTAPVAVSKTDNVKIITPENNQFADAWDIDYRKYHDLFVPDNKKAVIAVSVGA